MFEVLKYLILMLKLDFLKHLLERAEPLQLLLMTLAADLIATGIVLLVLLV